MTIPPIKNFEGRHDCRTRLVIALEGAASYTAIAGAKNDEGTTPAACDVREDRVEVVFPVLPVGRYEYDFTMYDTTSQEVAAWLRGVLTIRRVAAPVPESGEVVHALDGTWNAGDLALELVAGAPGKPGAIPHIGENGNWWIDGVDQGQPSVIDPAPLVKEEVQKAVTEVKEELVATPEGTDNALFHWCEIAAAHVPPGRVTEIAVRCRSTAAPQMTAEPRFLGVWEADEAGAFHLLGVSTNYATQSVGATASWFFDGLMLEGRRVRLCLLPTRESGWQAGSQVFGARVSESQDGSVISYTGGQSAWLPEVAIRVARAVPRFAPALHVADADVHVSSADRAAWNAKVDADTPINATQLIDPSNDHPVFVTSSEGLGYLAPPASGAVCLALTEGGHRGLPFVLITSPSAEVCMEPHQLRMFYGSQVFRLGGENGRITCGLSQKDATVEDVSASLEAVLQAPERVTRHAEDSLVHVPEPAARLLGCISDSAPSSGGMRVSMGDKQLLLGSDQTGGSCDVGVELHQARISANALSVAVFAGAEGITLRVDGVELLLDAGKLEALGRLLAA